MRWQHVFLAIADTRRLAWKSNFSQHIYDGRICYQAEETPIDHFRETPGLSQKDFNL